MVSIPAINSRAAAETAYNEFASAQLLAMTAGQTVGAYSMNRFSSKMADPYTLTPGEVYTHNPNLWCRKYLPVLTCVPTGVFLDVPTSYPHKQWVETWYGVLVTPQHLLQAAHAMILVKYDGDLSVIRFADEDGRTTDRQVYGAARYDYTWPVFAESHGDAAMLTLSEPVPSSYIIPPVCEYPVPGEWDIPNMHHIAFSQGYGYQTNRVPGSAPQLSDYPEKHDMMIWIPSPTVEGFRYGVWLGDSGTPRMLLFKGRAIVRELCNHAYLNNLIAKADADAIARGYLSEPTGYTVDVWQNPFLYEASKPETIVQT